MTVSDKKKIYDCTTCPYPRYKDGSVIFCDVCIRKILDEQKEKKENSVCFNFGTGGDGEILEINFGYVVRKTKENCCIKFIQQFPFLVNLITDILFNNDHNHRV